MNLENKIAVITGGASGLGLATVQAYLAKGAKVAIFDLNAEQGAIVAAELGENVLFCQVNVADEASVQEAIAATVAKFGGYSYYRKLCRYRLGGAYCRQKWPYALRYF
jgi:3-hydroxyacyl-CoA dehydrogenase/3-hydroxy-2-methylbutyryl-CoA dehydrogenase